MNKATGCVLVSLALAALSACAQPSIVQPPADTPGIVSGQVGLLAGTWEYEESGQVYSLVLDERGNGRYDFEDGRLETIGLTDHTWRGMWYQKKNDRDGGFEVTLAPDLSKGVGRWWYTRIEADAHPTKPGGAFVLRRVRPEPAP
jgi:hypothetical protein